MSFRAVVGSPPALLTYRVKPGAPPIPTPMPHAMLSCVGSHSFAGMSERLKPAFSLGHGACLPDFALGAIGHGCAQLLVPCACQCASQLLLTPPELT